MLGAATVIVLLCSSAALHAQGSETKRSEPSSSGHAGKYGQVPVSAARDREHAVQEIIHQVGESGRILGLAQKPSDRVNPPPQIAPGLPPVLAFRTLDRQGRYRLGRLDLVVDDAGH